MSIRSDCRRLRWSLRAIAPALLFVCIAHAADPLEGYRERFQQGLEQFRGGNVAGAVVIWESIRGEVNDETVYRLLYNLGKSYEILGDATRAVERYRAFVEQVDLHGQRERLEMAVIEQRVDAATRIEELDRTRGRIRILPSVPPRPVQVDGGEPIVAGKTLYVAPGKHRVTIEPTTPNERRIELDLKAGEQSIVDPAPAPVPAPPVASSAKPASSAPAPRDPRPFPPAVLAVAGGVTVASLIVPFFTYKHARGIYTEYNAEDTTIERRQQLVGEYTTARRTYALSWLVPGACLLATGGLTFWYTRGSRERVAVHLLPGPDVAMVGASGSF